MVASFVCYVSEEDVERHSGLGNQKQNKFVPLSEAVTACATHPINGTIIAGTKVCGFGASNLRVTISY